MHLLVIIAITAGAGIVAALAGKRPEEPVRIPVRVTQRRDAHIRDRQD